MNANWIIHNGSVVLYTLRGDAEEPIPMVGQFVCREDEIPEGVSVQPQGEEQHTVTETFAAGYLDAATGIRLPATEADQNRYTRMVTLSDILIGQGVITSQTPQTIVDLSGVEHSLSTDQLKGLLARFGIWCKTLLTLERSRH